jgi:hypothetical protein
MDELVGACSLIWSVLRNGKLLDNSDLLNGEVIRPMASDLSKRWEQISDALLLGVSAIRQHGFEYGSAKHFYSLYALAIPCAWLYIGEQWKEDHKLGVLETDEFDKKLKKSLDSYLDRWIMCSQWAGRWARSSETTVATYVKNLHLRSKEVEALESGEAVLQMLDEHLRGLVDDLNVDASNYVATAFPSVRRDRVSTYRNFLWIWHRLDDARWKMSQVQLRIGKPAPDWDVDHTVAFSLWQDKISLGLPDGVDEAQEALALVNRLGNCVLLEKNFNISKSKHPVSFFLQKVHEFKTGQLDLTDWCSALGVPGEMFEPDAFSVTLIKSAIDKRDKEMRDELADFARGKKSRTDLDLLPPVAASVATV